MPLLDECMNLKSSFRSSSSSVVLVKNNKLNYIQQRCIEERDIVLWPQLHLHLHLLVPTVTVASACNACHFVPIKKKDNTMTNT